LRPENATRRLYHFNAVKSIAHEEKNLHSKYKEDIMLKVFIELLVICLLGVEMYFCTAGNRHRRKKILKGWNPVKGTITAIDKKVDDISKKSYVELTIAAPEDRTVYAKLDNFSIYEVGEEVDLMELNGVHRFLGNERVDKKGRKETLIGTLPLLALIVVCAVITLIAHLAGK
jgi:hypothetical protein